MSKFGLDDEWDLTDEGDRMIYTMDPSGIPVSCAARVIHELRKDCGRLNDEVMEARADHPRYQERKRDE